MKILKSPLLFFLSTVFLVIFPLTSFGENGDVLRSTLANGLKVVIIQNQLAPVVTTEVNYLVGSNETPEGFPGMAHAQEHMMFRGSPGLSAVQLANIMALMGGEFNADTQQTVTQYYFTVPKDNLDVALNVEAMRMRDVLDTQELWEQERGAIEQEVTQDISNPDYLLSMQLLAEMFAGTPYAHDALGTRPSFEKTTGAMLKEFHHTWYAPNNAILVIAGDVDLQKTLALVKELFEPIPSRSVPARPVVKLQPLKADFIAFDTDLPYGLAVVAYRLPGYDSPDYAAGTILADALDSKRGELYALASEGKALSTTFDSSALPKAGYGYALAAFPQDGDGAAFVRALKDIISGYLKNGVPVDIVETAKRHEIAEVEFQKNSVSGLAAAWSDAIAVEGRNSPEDDINAIRNVTAEDVNRVARQYLVNDTAITAVLTPRPSGKPIASKGFGGTETFTPSETKPVELPTWAKKTEAVPTLPTSKVNPVVTTLPNGLRLIIQQESISPTVSVVGVVKNNANLEEPMGKEGVSDVLTDLFSYGTGSYDRLAFQKALDDIAADITAGTSFSLRVLSDRFERGMELLADDLLHPALPESSFAVVQQKLISSLRGQIQSPAYFSKRALREALYPKNDPVLRDATPESVAALSLKDVRAYYAKVFRPDMTTIVIIGQVPPERARGAVEKYFGSWKASGEKPQTDLPPVSPNKPAVAEIPDANSVQDQVTLTETVGMTRSNPDYYRLQLGNHVLSGAFYATRLYHDLREKAGLVYSVESFIDAGKSRSLFSVDYACDPPNAYKARALVERNLHEMQTTTVTQEELRRAKTLLVRQVPLREASIDSIAETLLSYSLEDLPLNESVRAAGKFLETTAEEVREVFAKWIRPMDFVQITVGPEPEPGKH
ncbi:MAG TPA: pitrilysin family protein [Nitrospirota bacterium]|nr:pitrilysin family protein [Nitrospirota bacterium]